MAGSKSRSVFAENNGTIEQWTDRGNRPFYSIALFRLLPVGIVNLSAIHDVPGVGPELLGDDDKDSLCFLRFGTRNDDLQDEFFFGRWQFRGWEKESPNLNLIDVEVGCGKPLAKAEEFLGDRRTTLGKLELGARQLFTSGANPDAVVVAIEKTRESSRKGDSVRLRFENGR
jgi:hypothetical protein